MRKGWTAGASGGGEGVVHGISWGVRAGTRVQGEMGASAPPPSRRVRGAALWWAV